MQCSYIVTPLNAYSNVFYLIAAYYMYKHHKQYRGDLALLFAICATITGVTSFLFHATYTYAGQLADFWGMFVFTSVPLVLGLQHEGVLSRGGLVIKSCIFSAASFIAVLVMAHLEWRYQLLVVAQVLFLIVLEVRARKRFPNHWKGGSA